MKLAEPQTDAWGSAAGFENGRPERTRTADLYRVKVAL